MGFIHLLCLWWCRSHIWYCSLAETTSHWTDYGHVGAYGSVGSVIYATTYSLLPQTVKGNRTFFQFLGSAGLIVCFLCAFILKEPAVVKSEALTEAPAFVGH